MNIGALSLAQTPPLAVPLRYFLTAPLFLIAAAGLLLWRGEVLLLSRWTPDTLALVHLLTLGVMTMVMAGALQQLLPVLIGTPVKPALLQARLNHALLTLGTAALVTGWLMGLPWLLGVAMVLLAAALLHLFLITAIVLWRSSSVHTTRQAMGLAIIGLLITTALGLDLLYGHTAPGYGLDRHLTDLHMLWGLGGWGAILLIGVAYQVVPMFQITPDYPAWMTRFVAPLGSLLLLVALGVGLSRPGSEAVEWLLWLAATVGGLFAAATLYLQQRRKRRLPDATLDFWRLAMVSWLLLLGLWLIELLGWLALPSLLLGTLFVTGTLFAAIFGMLYKIVPFLIWLHLNNRLQASGRWQGRAPNMKQIITAVQARRHLWLHGIAVVGIITALYLPETVARPAALIWLANAGLLGWNLLSALRIYRKTLRNAEAAEDAG